MLLLDDLPAQERRTRVIDIHAFCQRMSERRTEPTGHERYTNLMRRAAKIIMRSNIKPCRHLEIFVSP